MISEYIVSNIMHYNVSIVLGDYTWVILCELGANRALYGF